MFIDLVHRYVHRKYSTFGIASRVLALPSCNVHYYENSTNRRRTVVFLHGLGTSSSTWIHLLPHLAGSFHVVAIDLPGFGFSELTDGKHFQRYEELIASVGDILPRLVTGQFALVGHSLGGWLAADYAIRFQPVPEQMVLINPAGISYAGVDEQRALFNVKDLKSLYVLLNRLWWRYPWYLKIFGPAILSDLRKRCIAQFVQSVREEDFLNERLPLLRTPVSLIWGNDDGIISEKTVEIMKKSLPQLRTHVLRRCGHVPQLERPKELISVLDEVLKQDSGKIGG